MIGDLINFTPYKNFNNRKLETPNLELYTQEWETNLSTQPGDYLITSNKINGSKAISKNIYQSLQENNVECKSANAKYFKTWKDGVNNGNVDKNNYYWSEEYYKSSSVLPCSNDSIFTEYLYNYNVDNKTEFPYTSTKGTTDSLSYPATCQNLISSGQVCVPSCKMGKGSTTRWPFICYSDSADNIKAGLEQGSNNTIIGYHIDEKNNDFDITKNSFSVISQNVIMSTIASGLLIYLFLEILNYITSFTTERRKKIVYGKYMNVTGQPLIK